MKKIKRYLLNILYWLDAGVAAILGRDFRTTLSWNMAVYWKFRGDNCKICHWFCNLFPQHCENTLAGWTQKDVDGWFENYDAGLWHP